MPVRKWNQALPSALALLKDAIVIEEARERQPRQILETMRYSTRMASRTSSEGPSAICLNAMAWLVGDFSNIAARAALWPGS